VSSEGASAGLPRISLGVCTASVLVVLALLAGSPAALGLALVGTTALAAGLAWARDGALALGVTVLFGAVVFAGLDGRSTGWLLGAATPVVLSWTTGRYAVRLRRQMRGGETTRVELVQAVATIAALVAGGGVAYLLDRTVTGGESPLALGLLLVAVVAFTVALRR